MLPEINFNHLEICLIMILDVRYTPAVQAQGNELAPIIP